MPAYHSKLNSTDVRQIGLVPLLPIRTKIRGPATPVYEDSETDIIAEAIHLFRANCFFRNFEIKGPADRLLVYLTLYIQDLLYRLGQKPPATAQDAYKLMQSWAVGNFKIPGDAGFTLNALFDAPTDKNDSELLKQYLQQLRQEVVVRMTEILYRDGQLSKWWMGFQKRKFMGKAL